MAMQVQPPQDLIATVNQVFGDRAIKRTEALALMEKARLHVQCYHPWYGALASRLKLKPDWRHGTMYTDAVVLGFNPEFTMTLPWNAILYILIHEVTHCALGHPFRRGNRDPKVWNQAIDHVTNLTLNRDPELGEIFNSMKGTPWAGLADTRFNGMQAEAVYEILWAEKKERERKKQEAAEEKKKQQQNAPGGVPQPQEGGDQQSEQKPGEGNEELEELSGASGEPGDCLDAGASGEPMPDNFGDEKEDEEEEKEDEKGEQTPTDDDGEDSEVEDEDEDGDPEDIDDEFDDDENEDEDGEGEGDEGEEADDKADGDNDREIEIDPNNNQLDQAAIEELKREWEEAVMTAELAAGGDVPDAMRRALGQAREVNKDFNQHVDEFLEKCALVEQSWNRPARRFEIYMPSNTQPGMKTMVVGIDTSASRNDDQIALMQAASQRIMDDFKPRALIAIYCDTRVRGIDRFEQGEQVFFKNVRGGGGTLFHPVFRQVLAFEEEGEEIAGVIYLTDLEGSLHDAEDFEHIHTLWVVDNEQYLGPAPGGIGTVVSLE